jgi:drug/metabolite transporter (DMT)-like permease
VALALTAAALFATGTVMGTAAIPLTPIALAAWQVGLGCLAMLVTGLLFEPVPTQALSLAGWVSMIYMTVVAMGLSYITWFEASRRIPPTTASTVMLLVPVVGVLSAGLFLGEPVGVRQVVALTLTLGGVGLVVAKAR